MMSIAKFAHIAPIARCRRVHTTTITQAGRDDSLGRLNDLVARFKDPSSPFHLPPGHTGPASPDDHEHPYSASAPSSPALQFTAPDHESPGIARESDLERVYEKSRESGLRWLRSNGYDLRGRLEWPVAWGDCDMFQHANNVNYVRWFESARIKYTESFVDDLPREVLNNFLTGKGTGIILKDIALRYRIPVTYPDTVMIATRPHTIDQARASFGTASAMWSLKTNKLVATAEATIVMYDYDALRKGTMSDEVRQALQNRIQ